MKVQLLGRGFLLVLFSSSLSLAGIAVPKDESGIEGVIWISPTHGGPIRPGMQSTAPLPETEFAVRSGEKTVAMFKTDGEGKFRVNLPPGHYTVLRANWSGGVGRYGPFEVDVLASQVSKVQWNCDTGMR